MLPGTSYDHGYGTTQYTMNIKSQSNGEAMAGMPSGIPSWALSINAIKDQNIMAGPRSFPWVALKDKATQN